MHALAIDMDLEATLEANVDRWLRVWLGTSHRHEAPPVTQEVPGLSQQSRFRPSPTFHSDIT